ncbi:glucose-6-phosphate dehydrogenase [Marinibactrum halimedae]|uniref:Glucose-6-phosphate 1-dehydrogenase n=1 Tax=Marinibactrum halimedae TaxID=1444977 RepID=A0AA37TCR2_9GAMM|nr:glucose-6-phosphate dehydrogenase [Marinibactrum halimedae]MCD9460944.1 glucose-6-phosphate dehydrogenase [Marinibactrum halimedae]GLS27415.1 glucose-6-phosphate 1-dehydrogenase [Marinibactrum halimedae]
MAHDILIVGGDGDLALRKLYPSLFALELAGQLSNVSTITGVSRAGTAREELLDRMLPWLQALDDFDEACWDRFQGRFKFLKGDATKPDTLESYKSTMTPGGSGLIVYLAVPPKVFGGACRALKESGLAVPSTRIVVEKPLGSDRESFLNVNAEMSEAFDESQIYRIDHYLGKEAVQNLLALRFANVMFGALWDGNYIDHVQITVAERVGVEGRKEFYDEVGALRDMVQNHLLQVLCLVAMEPPTSRDAFMIRAEKLKVLKSLRPIRNDDIKLNTVRGQYVEGSLDGEVVPSYRSEVGEESRSKTETFVAIRAEIDNWRWSGVPFYLRTGKRMQTRASEILIQFKEPRHNIFASQGHALAPNQLRIQLQPDEGIKLHFLSKRPGLGDLAMEDVELNLSVPESRKKRSYDAYARLMLEVLNGDQTLFVSAEEVEASWLWIDEIIEQWQSAGVKAKPYPAGSSGPVDAAVMIARDGREWSDLEG